MYIVQVLLQWYLDDKSIYGVGVFAYLTISIVGLIWYAIGVVLLTPTISI